MNIKEKELFLLLCNFKKPNVVKIKKRIEQKCATPEVLGHLFSNRMAVVANGVLKEARLLDKVDREFRSALGYAELCYERRNREYFGCLNFVSAELNACEVPYALLKGAYLCSKYPKGYRVSNDIDVLVLPEDVGTISTRLKMAGFRQGHVKNGVFIPATRQEIIESKMTRGETIPFIKETKLSFCKYLEVDLNFSLDYKNSEGNTVSEMLSRVRTVPIEGGKIQTLDPYDFVLHVCAHLYKEATTMPWVRMQRDMTFYKYSDIRVLLEDLTEQDMEALLARAKEYGLENELAYGLNSAIAFFGFDCKKWLDRLPCEGLNDVIDPAAKNYYRYTESDLCRRFFSKDRTKMLEEVPFDGKPVEDDTSR